MVIQIGFDEEFGVSEFIGLSTDIKPTKSICPGSIFQEIDGSKNCYIYYDNSWILF